MNIEQERAEFETWRRKHFEYVDLDAFEMEIAWDAYQAGRAAQQSQDREDAERYRWLRRGGNDDIGVVRGFDVIEYGSSSVASTYEDSLCGDRLDAAIDAARQGEGGAE